MDKLKIVSILTIVLITLSVAPPIINVSFGSESTTTKPSQLPEDTFSRIQIAKGKQLVKLSGTPYQMGYWHGYHLAENVKRMTDNYTKTILESYDFPEPLIPGIFKLGTLVAKINTIFVPEEFEREMQGIADGAQAAGYDVAYEDVLLLNMGFDVALSIFYPLVTPFLSVGESISCDAFVVHGGGTKENGDVFMGRNFMFPGDPFSKVALLMEFDPEKGNKFVSVTAPGFVGVTSAMNEEGVGIGMDMVPSIDEAPIMSGKGTLLTAREAVQYADGRHEAKDIIEGSVRGVSWIYPIGEGGSENAGGIILEISARLSSARDSNYEYPDMLDFSRPAPIMPKQIENNENLVVTANHYIHPLMTLTDYPVEDSRYRYEKLTENILHRMPIDTEEGKKLANWLYTIDDRYKENELIGGTRTLYNLSEGRLWAMIGRYGDPWAPYDMDDPIKAEFKVSNLQVSPENVEPGENLNISANITNIGMKTGKHEVEFLIENEVENSKTVVLKGEESMTVEFKTSRAEEGEYKIKINTQDDEKTGSFLVEVS